MQRRQFTAGWMLGLTLTTHVGHSWAGLLSQADASMGVKAALEKGALAAIASLGVPGGYLDNPRVRIALPGPLEDAANLLKFTGQQKKVDELVAAMNRAAEAAVPEARDLLMSAIRGMSVQDGVKIVRGGDTSVTDFFVDKTRQPLGERFLPIVTRETERLSLAEKYNAVAGKASGFGLIGKEDANIQRYVTRKSLDGLYWMIGEEEKKIRRDPAGAGSELLKRVFG
jgi:hypothetical protein